MATPNLMLLPFVKQSLIDLDFKETICGIGYTELSEFLLDGGDLLVTVRGLTEVTVTFYYNHSDYINGDFGFEFTVSISTDFHFPLTQGRISIPFNEMGEKVFNLMSLINIEVRSRLEV